MSSIITTTTTTTSWRGTVVNTGYSCYLTAARRRRAQFLFFLVDLGPGAAVCGMRIETNTGYSCNLTAARSRQGQFLSLVDLGLGAPTDKFCGLGCGFLPILRLLIAFFLCLRFCSSHILPPRKKACRVDNIGVWGLLNLSSGGAQRAQKQQQRILFLP